MLRSFFARDGLRFGLAAGLASVAVSLATLAAGLSRVLPLLVERDVPLRASVPLFFGVLALSLEVGMLVGWPVGWVEAALRSRERGEARARRALGESPLRRVARLLPTAVVLFGFAFFASVAWGRDARAPGRIARELLAKARTACAGVRVNTVQHVPLVRASWLCRPNDATPLLLGEAAGGIDYVARDLFIADDLRGIEADEAQILAPSSVRIVAGHAKVQGLTPYTAPSSVPAEHRGLALASAGLVSALLATWVAIARPRGPRALSWAIAAAGPGAALLAIRSCERLALAGGKLVVVPLSALAGVIGATVVVAVGVEIAKRLRHARRARQRAA